MNHWLLEALFIALGGAVGGAARYWVSDWAVRRWGDEFPWGTLLVNGSGAAVIGVIASMLSLSGAGAGNTDVLWAGLVIGLLGSYTTVSSFSWQTLVLVQSGRPARALANVSATVLLCLTLAAAGYELTTRVLG